MYPTASPGANKGRVFLLGMGGGQPFPEAPSEMLTLRTKLNASLADIMIIS